MNEAVESSLSPYTYELPKERIAQRPVHPPESARMLVVERSSGRLSDRHFSDLPNVVTANDRLVFNDTRVIPARLFGRLSTGAEVEILLVRLVKPPDVWVCIGRPLKKIRSAGRVAFEEGLSATVVDDRHTYSVTLRFESSVELHVADLIRKVGTMPIPPYIRDGRGDDTDREDYQTFFARNPGSVAAPTASLHFSPSLMHALTERGCATSFLTLHVGTASFMPVLVQGELRPPACEELTVGPGLMDDAAKTRADGGRIVAVGTTVVRALESAARNTRSGDTSLFIQPGHEFRSVDALVTNFHQPGTTHLLLVEALLGRELLAEVYEHALASGYRFLSYGDGMIIV